MASLRGITNAYSSESADEDELEPPLTPLPASTPLQTFFHSAKQRTGDDIASDFLEKKNLENKPTDSCGNQRQLKINQENKSNSNDNSNRYADDHDLSRHRKSQRDRDGLEDNRDDNDDEDEVDEDNDEDEDDNETAQYAPIHIGGASIKVISITDAPAQSHPSHPTDINIPSSPPEASPYVFDLSQGPLGEWVEWALQLRVQGTNFNHDMFTRREFRNPAILEKMVDFCDLDEYASNYPHDRFNVDQLIALNHGDHHHDHHRSALAIENTGFATAAHKTADAPQEKHSRIVESLESIQRQAYEEKKEADVAQACSSVQEQNPNSFSQSNSKRKSYSTYEKHDSKRKDKKKSKWSKYKRR